MSDPLSSHKGELMRVLTMSSRPHALVTVIAGNHQANDTMTMTSVPDVVRICSQRVPCRHLESSIAPHLALLR